MYQLIKSDTDTGQFVHTIRNNMKVKNFLLYITGVGDVTGIFQQDVGRVYIRGRGNRDLVSADFDYLQLLNDYEGGAAAAVNMGAAGAYYLACIIPRSLGDNNVELIEPEDNYTLEINFGANIAAHTASGFRCSLYADLDKGLTTYQLLLHQKEDQLGTGSFTENYTTENIIKCYLSDRPTSADCLDLLGAGNILNVTVKCAGQSGFIETRPLIYGTNIKKQLETITTTAAEIYAGEGGMSSRLADELEITYLTGAAAAPQLLFVGCYVNPTKRNLTEADEAAELVRISGVKDRNYMPRTAQAVRRIIG